MALAREIMQGGISSGAAKAINGGVSSTVTAAGTVITDAFDLTTSLNIITTAAAGSGVQLPYAEIGDSVEILNVGANPVKVYPDASANQINQIAAAGPFTLATNTSVVVRKLTTTRWVAYLSA